LYERLVSAWPDQAGSILEANNAHPPMMLRVNRQRIQRDTYLEKLLECGIEATAGEYGGDVIELRQSVGVEQLPGFSEGWVSVQDGAAQLAAHLLNLKPGQRVLDACAAPGGKTCHILEICPELETLVAIDKDEERLDRVSQNLERLGMTASLLCVDAGEPEVWWDGRPFDRILLDAPCSATGVIRRHPDIKILRRPEDIKSLVLQQDTLLARLWPLVAPGGMLLYATCSVLPEENTQQIEQFVSSHADAVSHPINADWGLSCQHGRQILPGDGGMDGFYYACLVKQ
jgi:16S rRNA (cytosine967-C5)-methyltransferase